MSWHVRVVRNRYADSVRLMALAKDLRGRSDIAACEVAMGTAANLEALAALGADVSASPADVVLAVDAGAEAAAAALGDAEAALAAAV
jgi:S-adenosylhomocysteine hydrolase